MTREEKIASEILAKAISPEQRLYNQVYYQTKIKPSRSRKLLQQRLSMLKSRTEGAISMTVEEFDALLLKQNNKCAICGVDHSILPRGLHIDHKGSKVRGLLCHQCNVLIGFAQDNPVILQAAIHYLCEDLFDRIK